QNLSALAKLQLPGADGGIILALAVLARGADCRLRPRGQRRALVSRLPGSRTRRSLRRFRWNTAGVPAGRPRPPRPDTRRGHFCHWPLLALRLPDDALPLGVDPASLSQ